jgi:hypothetical protein
MPKRADTLSCGNGISILVITKRTLKIIMATCTDIDMWVYMLSHTLNYALIVD